MPNYGEQPTRLLCPRDSPGKNIGVGCHFLLRFQNTHAPLCSLSDSKALVLNLVNNLNSGRKGDPNWKLRSSSIRPLDGAPRIDKRIFQSASSVFVACVFWNLRRKWQPTPIFLPGESLGQRSLVGYTVHGVTRSDTTEWAQARVRLRYAGGYERTLESSLHCWS